MWTERVLEGKYTAPSGAAFVFLYEDLLKETDLKTSTFTFPDKDGAHVQSLGRGGRRFPLSFIFSGPDCMDDGDECESALEEIGVGELQHPTYGTRKVVPTGTIKRSDKLASGANETIIDITLAETIVDTDFPESSEEGAGIVSEKMDAYEEAAAEEFAGSFKSANAGETIKGISTFSEQNKIINNSLTNLAKKDSGVWSKFQGIWKEIESSIDDVFTYGLNAARRTLNLIKTPSRLLTNARAKLEGYSSLIDQIAGQFAPETTLVGAGENNTRNQAAVTRLSTFTALAAAASGIAISSVEADETTGNDGGSGDPDEYEASASLDKASYSSGSSTSGTFHSGTSAGSSSSRRTFETREAMLDVADRLISILVKLQETQDSMAAMDLYVDTGGSYLALIEVVYASIKLITQMSFSLPTRKIITLDKDRQCLELVAELYGDLGRLDDFIIDNDLTADEIEMLPMGKEVVYYVKVA